MGIIDPPQFLSKQEAIRNQENARAASAKINNQNLHQLLKRAVVAAVSDWVAGTSIACPASLITQKCIPGRWVEVDFLHVLVDVRTLEIARGCTRVIIAHAQMIHFGQLISIVICVRKAAGA